MDQTHNKTLSDNQQTSRKFIKNKKILVSFKQSYRSLTHNKIKLKIIVFEAKQIICKQ